MVIYDKITRKRGIVNIYHNGFNCFEDYEGLLRFFKSRTKQDIRTSDAGERADFAREFCRKWIAGGKETDTIIDGITADICKELGTINKKGA